MGCRTVLQCGVACSLHVISRGEAQTLLHFGIINSILFPAEVSLLASIVTWGGRKWYHHPLSTHAPNRQANEANQAHRIITQVFLTGARVFGRAFAEAYKQASASQKFASHLQSNPTAANTLSASGLTLQEACSILNVAPPKSGQADLGRVHEQFKRLFDMNDPQKGGSFYLQSKVLRARERIELEVCEAEKEREREVEMREGWKPKLYKDR